LLPAIANHLAWSWASDLFVTSTIRCDARCGQPQLRLDPRVAVDRIADHYLGAVLPPDAQRAVIIEFAACVFDDPWLAAA